MSKPFLKWAGGKTKLIPLIRQQLPSAKRLIEPFAGSAAVSLALDFDEYVLNDANADLINLYRVLQTEKHDFVDYAQSFFTPENNRETRYYELRERFNHTAERVEKAALFVYLNRHAFNGLCRYNGKGGFNVPFGRYKLPYFPAAEMSDFIAKSARMKLMCGDFQAAFDEACADSAVYCDPPYVPLSDTAAFTAYSQGGFGWQDQVRLLQCAERVAEKCRGVLLSNHDTEATRTLYRNAQIETVQVRRSIAAKGSSRQKVGELLARWHDIEFALG